MLNIKNYIRGDPEATIALERFLTNLEIATTDESVEHVETSLLFTDIVGSSAIFENFGDKYGRGIVSIHDDIIGEAMEKSNGKKIKHTGDGILGSFESCGRSVKTATKILKKMKAHNEKFPLLPLNIRMGINVGNVITEDKDVYGSSVNLAARVCDLASSNKVFTTGIVHSRCKDKGYGFISRGTYEVNGFRQHIPIFEVA